jgi:hypothetical protein
VLVVKLELWPHGDEARKQVIGTGIIVNDGSGSPTVGHYDTYFTGADADPHQIATVMYTEGSGGKVVGFRRARGAWTLVWEALTKWSKRYGY